RLREGFYTRIRVALKAGNAWFATASQVVDWLRARRSFSNGQVDMNADSIRVKTKSGFGGSVVPNLIIRTHWPNINRDLRTQRFTDVTWTGEHLIDIPVPQFAQV